MIIPLKFNDQISSNLFLRKLWSEFRKIEGFHSFSTPAKLSIEHKVFLGIISLNQSISCGVTIHYKQKGIIQKIEFNSLEESDQKLVQQKVEVALNQYEQDIKLIPMTYFFQSSSFCVAPYKFQNFSIEVIKDNYNIFKVTSEGYDKIDAMTFSKFQLNTFLDIIASQTLSSFHAVKSIEFDSSMKSESMKDNLYADDLKLSNHWYFGEYENQFFLSKELLCNIDHIFSSNLEDEILAKLLSASRLFHNGLKLETIDFQNNTSFNEVSHTLYVSALEVLATIEPLETERCTYCTQLQFKISKRVQDLVSRKTNNESLVNFIKQEYNKRSKFLHTGQYFSEENFIGYHVPQLSKSHSSGNELQHNLSDTTRSIKVLLRSCILDELKKMGT